MVKGLMRGEKKCVACFSGCAGKFNIEFESDIKHAKFDAWEAARIKLGDEVESYELSNVVMRYGGV